MENNNFFCHIIGINQVDKKKLYEFSFIKEFHIIDLDLINKDIFNNIDLKKMFKQFTHFKSKKNEKYKEIEKKMNNFWKKSIKNFIENSHISKKKNIIIGNNSHYRNITKKIEIQTNNKFVISTTNNDIKNIIKYNLENNTNEIINGTYSLNNLNFDYIKKTRNKIKKNYVSNGYNLYNFEQIVKILNLMSKKKKKIPGLFMSLNEPYNISTKIYPSKNKKLLAYKEPVHALLSSFNWNNDELQKIYKGKTIKIIEKIPNSLDKLKEKRFLYYVDSDTFIPHEKGNNMKFFSQVPVMILDKDKIQNVYKKLNELGLF